MTTLYLIASIFTALMLTCDIFILIHPHLSIKKYPIFLLSISIFFLMQFHLNFSPMLFISLVTNSILLVKFSKKLYSAFYIPFGYIVNCIITYLVGFALSKFSGLSIVELHTNVFF